jgi:RNA polymerase sigma-32 factor
LEDLSKDFGVSRERVRQIEVRAFEKVQRAIRNMATQDAIAQTKATERFKAD